MGRGDHAVGQFTRGWEVFGNFVAMARVSLMRQISCSLVIGLIVGALWFRATLDEQQRLLFGDYVKCAITWMNSRDHHAYASLNTVFGGRTVTFLGQQWLFRSLTCAAVAFVVLTWVVTLYGARLSRSKHLRGSEIFDVKKTQRSECKQRRWLYLLLGFCSTYPVVICQINSALLGDYITAEICVRFPAIARLISVDAHGAMVWFDGLGKPGFRDPVAMQKALAPFFSQHSVTVLLAEWATLALIVAAMTSRFKLKQQKCTDLVLADVPISRNVEGYHFLVCGSPGSGKSTAIKELLDQIRRRGEKAVIYDCSGEYISAYYREGRDIILNPMDSRAAPWTPWAEMRRKEDCYTLGRSLFPADGRDPFWADAGAQLFASVIEVLGRTEPTNKALANLLLRARLAELHTHLQGTPGARFMDPDAGPMPTNVLATVASKLGVWDTLRDAPNDVDLFSIRRFIESDDDRWLFLSSRRDQHDTVKPLLSLWCDVAATAILSLPVIENPARKWVILDEVASLQRLPALPPLLDLGRKHGGAVVLGLQSIAQLRMAYGHDGAAALASEPQTWLVLRSVEPETARWLESALCSAEQEEVHESLSMGSSSMRDGVSLQHTKAVRPVVLASEVMTLPDLEGFLKKPKDPRIFRVSYKIRSRPHIADGFVDVEVETEATYAQHPECQKRPASNTLLRERGLLSR